MAESLYALLMLIVEMTPYLMFGFLCAGILHVAVPQSFYKNYLSQNSFKSVVLAALFGIPLPLCSCGVLPTAMSLRKEGASKGATTAFLTATPQTGVDSILATYSVFGWAFTIIRPIAAIVTSLFSGGLVALFSKNDDKTGDDVTENACTDDCCDDDCCNDEHTSKNKIIEALRYGYVSMLQDIGTHLVIGLIIAGLIAICIPDSFLLQFSSMPLLEMVAATVIAIPMYVCATGSIPIAAALMLKGLTPGAALVFLMAGPAVSFASLVVVKKVMGMKTMLIYLASIIIGAFSFGLIIDYLMPLEWFSEIQMVKDCCDAHFPIASVIITIVFTLLLINAILKKYLHKSHYHECSHDTIVYKVDGMKCNHCKASVEKNISEIKGVESVTADLTTNTVVVHGHVDSKAIQSVIESLGFSFLGKNNDEK